MATVTPIKDRIERKSNVIELRAHRDDLYPHDRLSHRWCQVCADFERDGTWPVWIRRMNERGLPDKDMTNWQPGPDAA